ncbi:MAG: porin family protein [Akkermansia sp.]|nr:porin family protein [Akkermansia sp.]
MKKLLSTMTLLGALSGAASALPYYTAVPAGGELTPYDAQPVYSIDALYTIGAGDVDLDMWGVRGSFNLYSSGEATFRHQASLNISPQWGDENEADFFALPLTIGYDVNIELTDDVLFYMGAQAGYSWWNAKDAWGEANEGGFIWAVGAGLKFQCSDDVYIRTGYEFGRTYLGGEIDDIYGGHTIMVGVGVTF